MPWCPQRFRDLRIKQGLTQQIVADLLGIAATSIYRYEQGRITPKLARVEELAQILATTPEYLMGRTSDPARVMLTDLSREEAELVRAFRQMNKAERTKVKNMVLRAHFRGENLGEYHAR